jgi:uncharacterized protein DUF6776
MNYPNLVIKRQRHQFWYAAVVLMVLLLLVATFLIGRYLALADLAETKQSLIQVELELADSKRALKETSESLVIQRQSSQVDDQSNLALVNDVKMMQQTQKSLEEELKFYRKIMAPEREKDGLSVDSIQIVTVSNSQEFNFIVTLIQAGKQSQYLKGDIIVKVKGLLNNKNTEYDFRELGAFKTQDFQFQFKYFQNIQGSIRLPKGFVAKEVVVKAKTKGRKKNQKAEKQMIWQPEESQKYVR